MKNCIENSENLGKNIQQENNSKQVSTQSLSFSYQFFCFKYGVISPSRATKSN